MELHVVLLLCFLGLTESSKPVPRRESQGTEPPWPPSNEDTEGSPPDEPGWPDPDCGLSLGPMSPDDGVRTRRATEGQFPWMVFLTAKDSNKSWTCSGSIILDDVILTAAGCVNGTTTDTIKIEAGIVDVITKGPCYQKRKAKKIIIHDKYSQDYRHDIALVQLRKPFDFDKGEGVIGTVCILETSQEFSGEDVTVMGWPSLRMQTQCICDEVGERYSYLRAVDVTVNQDKDCRNSSTLPHDANLTFCGRICNKASCQVGVGGAAVQKPEDVSVQVGIATGGSGSAMTPGYYTRLSYFKDWIQKELEALKGNTYKQ